MIPTLADIVEARRRMTGRVLSTPLAASDWLSATCGEPVVLKVESLQHTRSFKPRGAFNALLELLETAGRCTSDARLTVVTASAGNHGLAIAYAAEALGIRAIVFTPRHAPATKLEAICHHGAELRRDAADYDEAEILAKAFAASARLPFISPYAHPAVIAGAGTIGLEMLEQAPDLESIVVPVGGGGLISGIVIAAKSIAPRVRVIGVESTESHPFADSLAAGHIVRIVAGTTIADGLAGNLDPGSITFDIVRDHVDTLVQVSDPEIERAIRGLVQEEDVVAEGAGAAAVAAVLSGKVQPRGRTAIVVSGGNIDAARLASMVAGDPRA